MTASGALASPPRRSSSRRRAPRVTVIGAGLGGLSAAIHLRLAGYSVSVLEKEARAGGRANLISDRGFRFDTGPTLLNYPWVFERLFESAGRSLRSSVELLAVDPSIRFQWPDGAHLTLSSDRERFAGELARFERRPRAALDRFFADAGAKYRLAFEKLACRDESSPLRWFAALSAGEMVRSSVWRSLYGELSRFFESRHVREALGSYGMYLGGSPFDLPGLFSILPYGEMQYGLWLPRGGIYALVAAIEQLAREVGVTVHAGTPVERIVTRSGRVAGVEVQGSDFQPAETVVSNVDAPTTRTKLLDERPPQVAMTPGVLTFYWGLRGAPANLGHHTIFLPSDYRGAFRQLTSEGRIPDDLPFYVAMPSATDRGLAPEGHSSVFVLAPTPVLSRLGAVDWGETAARVKARILERLRLHGVDLGPRIVFERRMTPEDWRGRFGLYDGSAFGAAHSLFQLGPFRQPNRSREISGLYFAGASTVPGTGMPMVVLGGKMVADRITANVRR